MTSQLSVVFLSSNQKEYKNNLESLCPPDRMGRLSLRITLIHRIYLCILEIFCPPLPQ
jgi:hypothetical protein